MNPEMIKKADVMIYGGTPAGNSCAISAARFGLSVILVEPHAHLGGMSASGLGKSDIEHREMIRGIFTEFTDRVHNYYLQQYGEDSEEVRLCQQGYYYEPSVAERIFEEMIAEQKSIEVLKQHLLVEVHVESGEVNGAEILNRKTSSILTIQSKCFVDCSYEGDLYAKAGAEFRLGRESREAFQETYAGHIYYDYENCEILPGSTGKADDHLPAYTYRLCFTTDPKNSVRLNEEPEYYDRNLYLPYLEDLREGRMSAPKEYHTGWGYHRDHFDTIMRVFSVTNLPNQKCDVNINPRPLAFPFPEENKGYVEGDDEQREKICRRHRNLALGLLYFAQNDPEVSEKDRELANRYHLPKDEFTDHSHFPFQLYVREARRLVGEYILTEKDIVQPNRNDIELSDAKQFEDAIAVGEFPIDSFPCRKRQKNDTRVLEGYLGMLAHITRPYQIPYRIMIPQEVDSLIVPVAASTSHVAYSSIRMEPTWMAMGQAAGTACAISLKHNVPLRDVPVQLLQEELIRQGQVIDRPEILK